MIYTILLIFFLLLMGCFYSASSAKGSWRGDRPPIYRNENFITLIELLLIPAIIIFIILLFLKWKITLIVSFVAWILNAFGISTTRISEYVIVTPLAKLLMKER